MKFSQELREEAQPIIERIYNDNFIQELLVGTLPKQAVRQYLRGCIIFKRIYKLICLTYSKGSHYARCKILS